MSPRSRWFDEPDDEPNDESPDDSALGSPECDTIHCPVCDADIYDDAVQCPHCGHYIEADISPWRGKSLWWIVAGLLGVVAALAALAGLANW